MSELIKLQISQNVNNKSKILMRKLVENASLMGSDIKMLYLRLLKILLVFISLKSIESYEYSKTIQQCADSEQCLSQINSRTVSMIEENIKSVVDPCNNFWAYACGNWAQHHVQFGYMDNFDAVEDYYTGKLQNLLENRSTECSTPHLWIQLSDYYAACKALSERHLKMKSYMEELPVELNWLNELFKNDVQYINWIQATALLRRYGLNGVYIDESVGVAYNDSMSYAVQLSMPNEDSYFSSKEELLNYMLAFGLIERITRDYEKLATEIFDLELQLRSLSIKYRNSESIEEPLNLVTLQQKIPQIDWQIYFNLLIPTTTREHLPLDLKIEVADVEYFQQLGLLLQRSGQRRANFYLLMRLCKFLLDIRPSHTDKRCILHMGALLPLGMTHIYEQHIYKTRNIDEQLLQKIFNELKTTFQRFLKSNKMQLSSLEQQYLLSKLQYMHLHLGNLPRAANIDWFDHHYSSVNISATNFYHNHWQMLGFRTRYQHAQLLTNGGRLDLNTYYVNDDLYEVRNAPYFVHQRNMLVVPLNFMQLPFFQHAQHAVFHYSLMGWILAHELNHAFELEGIIFDAMGNESPTGFAIRRQISFIAAHDCLNRTVTAALKERVADVNGLQLVYDAYFNATNEKSNKHFNDDYLSFSGRFNSQQIFYLNFAQFFCGTLPKPIQHDRDDVRVNVMVSNMQEFNVDFNCAQKSDEVETCQMWR